MVPGSVSMAFFFCWILLSGLSGIGVTRCISVSLTVWPSSCDGQIAIITIHGSQRGKAAVWVGIWAVDVE